MRLEVFSLCCVFISFVIVPPIVANQNEHPINYDLDVTISARHRLLQCVWTNLTNPGGHIILTDKKPTGVFTKVPSSSRWGDQILENSWVSYNQFKHELNINIFI